MYKKETRKYETVIVYNPDLNKDRLNQEIESVKKLITENGAEGVEASVWGKRELAYRTKKQKQGIYVIFKYPSANHGVVSVLASQLRINDRLIKFQTHVINERLRKFKGNPKRVAEGLAGSEEDSFFSEEEFS